VQEQVKEREGREQGTEKGDMHVGEDGEPGKWIREFNVQKIVCLPILLNSILASQSQRDGPGSFCLPLPYPRWGDGGLRLIYDLDIVCKVAKEERLELEMETSVLVYGSGVWCVCRCMFIN
jgi:hypothetical protein